MKKTLKLSSILMVLVALFTLTSCAPKADKVVESVEKNENWWKVSDSKTREFIEDILDEETIESSFTFATGENPMIADGKMNENDYVVAIYFLTKDNAKEGLTKLKEAYEKDGIRVKRSGKCVYFGTAAGMKAFA